jgi:regulation of enolase protein 1 (concanavalin A-like superfamily)
MTKTIDFYWVNEPQNWSHEGGILSVTTDEKTDFWNKTWYGFERFSGHFFGVDVVDDFTFQVKVKAGFHALYDQAGVMFLADKSHWLKAGVELNDGAPAIGSVLTLNHSDWATGVFPDGIDAFWMRLTRKRESLRLQYSTDGKTWPLLRLAHFPKFKKCAVGVMCCTPERSGLSVQFEDFLLAPAFGKDLHDLS